MTELRDGHYHHQQQQQQQQQQYIHTTSTTDLVLRKEIGLELQTARDVAITVQNECIHFLQVELEKERSKSNELLALLRQQQQPSQQHQQQKETANYLAEIAVLKQRTIDLELAATSTDNINNKNNNSAAVATAAGAGATAAVVSTNQEEEESIDQKNDGVEAERLKIALKQMLYENNKQKQKTIKAMQHSTTLQTRFRSGVTRVSRMQCTNTTLQFYNRTSNNKRSVPSKIDNNNNNNNTVDNDHSVAVDGKYSGPVVKLKPNGAGIMTFDNGDLYIGMFTNGTYDFTCCLSFEYPFHVLSLLSVYLGLLCACYSKSFRYLHNQSTLHSHTGSTFYTTFIYMLLIIHTVFLSFFLSFFLSSTKKYVHNR